MKKASLCFLIILLVFLLACNNKSQSASPVVTETPTEGYFFDTVSDVLDKFGEKTGEKHTIKATATGYSKQGNVKGEVILYFNASGETKKSFEFVVTTTPKIGHTLYKTISYKIDDKEYVFERDYTVLRNEIPEDSEQYQIIFNALCDSKDIKFSFNNGDLITTIHGEGFASLVKPNN